MDRMHVAVVGAGVFGAWTAYSLLETGARVTLIDAYGPGNSRSSSGDETRIVRCGYGPDRIYSDLARASLAEWRALDARSGLGLWHACGVLWMAAGRDPYTAATARTLDAAGYPYERLDVAALRDRFPEIDTAASAPRGESIAVALFEPDAGVVLARRAVRALVDELARRGVDVRRGAIDAPVDAGRGIRLRGGAHLDADRVVFACGAWLPRLFPDLLGGRIRPTRQVVVYFGTPAGDARFHAPRWPAWIDFPAGIYGTPDLEGRGVKVGLDEHGPPIDPDADDRVADATSLERARAWLARRVPALADAPVVESRVCQYENTSSGDFLIDRHPHHPDIVLAGGGSGHGFKHGPAVGRLAARLVLTADPPDERFALTHKTTDARRTIY
jgi:glycine/D-amino acid oxidase-like deaminating enzyme